MEFTIETPRLILRNFKTSDAKEYFAITKAPDIRQYLPGAHQDSIQDTRRLIQKRYSKCDFEHDFYMAIEEKISHKIIGALSITIKPFLSDFDCAYFIGENHRRQGYMKEALSTVLKHEDFCEKSIFFVIEESNEPSQGLIKQIEGVTEHAHSDSYVFVFRGMA